MPFTYLIRFKPTGQLYYGSRTKNGCAESDLWTIYFTSSKIVRGLIERYGKDAFDTEVRQRFESREEALRWEKRFLQRVNAKESRLWLNQANSAPAPMKFHTEETKQKLREAGLKRKHSPETKAKMKAIYSSEAFREAASTGAKKQVRDETYRANMAAAIRGSKQSAEHVRKRIEARLRTLALKRDQGPVAGVLS